MTMRPVRLRRSLILALTVACAACALQDTSPVKPALGGVEPSGVLRERPKGPEYVAAQLALGQEGQLYLLWLTVEWQKSWDVLFSHSEDFGATWSPPRSLKPDKAAVAGGFRIAAGPSNTVYVAWREWGPKTKRRTLRFMRSTDGGGQWGDSIGLPDPPSDLGMPDLLVNRGGDLSIAWLTGPRERRDLEVVSSHDAGTTFPSKPIRLTAVSPKSPYGITNHRVTSDGEGRLYLVWEEIQDWGDHRIYLNRSMDRGQTWTAQPILVSTPEEGKRLASMPKIAALPSGRVYVVWEQHDDRPRRNYVPGTVMNPDKLVYVNRSLDYGQTWLARQIRLNEAGQGPTIDSSNPQLSADRHDNVYVTWVEEAGPKRGRILFARSPDAGLTWSAPGVRLDLASPFKGRPLYPEVRSDDAGHVWVIWQELTKDKGWQLLMNRSDDHGQTWLPQAIALTRLPQRGESFRGVSFQNGPRGQLYVAWDGGPGNDQEIFFNRSADFGTTWLSSEVQFIKP